MKSLSLKLARDTRGANMVEYIILIGVVAFLAAAGFKHFSDKVRETVTNQGNSVEAADNKPVMK